MRYLIFCFVLGLSFVSCSDEVSEVTSNDDVVSVRSSVIDYGFVYVDGVFSWSDSPEDLGLELIATPDGYGVWVEDDQDGASSISPSAAAAVSCLFGCMFDECGPIGDDCIDEFPGGMIESMCLDICS